MPYISPFESALDVLARSYLLIVLQAVPDNRFFTKRVPRHGKVRPPLMTSRLHPHCYRAVVGVLRIAMVANEVLEVSFKVKEKELLGCDHDVERNTVP